MAYWALLPLPFFIIQIIRPTILIWGFITLPWCLYTLIGCYYLIRNIRKGIDSDFMLGIVVIGIFTGLTCLFFVCFPKNKHRTGPSSQLPIESRPRP